MNDLFNQITELHITPISGIITLQANQSGGVELEVKNWTALVHVIGTINSSIREKQTDAGTQIDFSLNASLKDSLAFIEPCILKITVATGDAYLVGDSDLPIFYQCDHSAFVTKLTIDHQSWHYPYKIII